jgi:hypothetical protein
LDVARHARHIALPEIGPEGQARISAARVVVVGRDVTTETAATYLRAAGVGQVVEATEAMSVTWHRDLPGFDLLIRSGFDDNPVDGIAAHLGVPAIVVRATSTEVDLVSFSGRVPAPDAPAAIPFKAGEPASNEATAVLAGTLAAAEALHLIVREGAGPVPPRIKHLRLPVDGREPLVQEIGKTAP